MHPLPLSNLGIIVVRNGGYIFITGKSRILRCDHVIQNQDFSMCNLRTVTFGAIVFLAEPFFIRLHSEPEFTTEELLLPSRCRRIFWRVKCSHLFCQSPYVIVLAWVNSSQVRLFWLRTYIIFFFFNFYGSVHRNNYSNIYPTRCNFTQFILSGNCSTCFGWYLHPSSGAQTTVSTASGINP